MLELTPEIRQWRWPGIEHCTCACAHFIKATGRLIVLVLERHVAHSAVFAVGLSCGGPHFVRIVKLGDAICLLGEERVLADLDVFLLGSLIHTAEPDLPPHW